MIRSKASPSNHPEPEIRKNSFVSCIVNWPPAGANLEFLSEFSDFLSGLVFSPDKVVMVGDFNIHMDVDSHSSKLAFISLLESIDLLVSPLNPL